MTAVSLSEPEKFEGFLADYRARMKDMSREDAEDLLERLEFLSRTAGTDPYSEELKWDLRNHPSAWEGSLEIIRQNARLSLQAAKQAFAETFGG